MRIKWFPPLDRFFGPESSLDLTGQTSLAELLTRLMDGRPEFEPFAKFGPGDTQPYGLLVWRRGKVLNLQDVLQPEDELEMIVMVSGG